MKGRGLGLSWQREADPGGNHHIPVHPDLPGLIGVVVSAYQRLPSPPPPPSSLRPSALTPACYATARPRVQIVGLCLAAAQRRYSLHVTLPTSTSVPAAPAAQLRLLGKALHLEGWPPTTTSTDGRHPALVASHLHPLCPRPPKTQHAPHGHPRHKNTASAGTQPSRPR